VAGRSHARGSVTSRALDVLEAFTSQHRSLTLTELSHRSRLPLSTTHRLAAELTDRGILDRDGDGLFHVGLRLWEIGALAPASHGLREAALPYLEDLYETTHENVQLAVLDGTQAVFIERLSGHESVHIINRAGDRLPVHVTGVGLILLAYAPNEIQNRILDSTLIRYTKHTITDPKRLRRILADIRLKGWVISDRQIELVSTSIAAPIQDTTGAVVAALSIVVSSKHPEPRQYISAVMAAGRGVSRNLKAP
jgi:DNA-binding IclR family transcriptional regulator